MRMPADGTEQESSAAFNEIVPSLPKERNYKTDSLNRLRRIDLAPVSPGDQAAAELAPILN